MHPIQYCQRNKFQTRSIWITTRPSFPEETKGNQSRISAVGARAFCDSLLHSFGPHAKSIVVAPTCGFRKRSLNWYFWGKGRGTGVGLGPGRRHAIVRPTPSSEPRQLCGYAVLLCRPDGARGKMVFEKKKESKKGPTLLSDTPHPRFSPKEKQNGSFFFFPKHAGLKHTCKA